MAYTTRQQLIDRIFRFYYDGIPSDDASLSNNEVDLYINDAIASVINKQALDSYNITGIMQVPEGYVTTYTVATPSLNDLTGFYSSTIPHPPFGMPGDNGISSVFFGGGGGMSRPILHVKPNEVDYFSTMPMPPQAAFYWIEGNRIFFWCRTDISHITDTIYIRMTTNVQADNSTILNIPPDAVELVFSDVIQKLLPRKNIRQDNVTDGIDMA